jgi:hypothetical protein
MRTLLFCTSYIADAAEWQQRYARWLAHHTAIDWGDCVTCMIDDGSPYVPPRNVIASHPTTALPDDASKPLLLRFDERLGRPIPTQYPGWWRSFLYSAVVAQRYGCGRIVHVESDTYILTKRTTRFLLAQTSGWTALWCPRWRFPETCVQVICADQFAVMRSMWTQGWRHYAGQYAEQVLPFTQVVREPHGNRYGENRIRIPSFADFAAQVRPDQAVWYR